MEHEQFDEVLVAIRRIICTDRSAAAPIDAKPLFDRASGLGLRRRRPIVANELSEVSSR